MRLELPAIHTHVRLHGHVPRLRGRVALVLVLVAAKGESHHLLAAATLVTPC